MNNNKKLEKNVKGFVLVLTLFTALILSALIIGFINISAIDLNLIKNHMLSLKAYYTAEAGVADAINRIRLNGLLADSQWEEYFPSGMPDKYTVAVSQNSTVINSTGHASVSNFYRILEVKINVSGSSPPYKVSIRQWKEKIAQ